MMADSDNATGFPGVSPRLGKYVLDMQETPLDTKSKEQLKVTDLTMCPRTVPFACTS